MLFGVAPTYETLATRAQQRAWPIPTFVAIAALNSSRGEGHGFPHIALAHRAAVVGDGLARTEVLCWRSMEQSGRAASRTMPSRHDNLDEIVCSAVTWERELETRHARSTLSPSFDPLSPKPSQLRHDVRAGSLRS